MTKGQKIQWKKVSSLHRERAESRLETMGYKRYKDSRYPRGYRFCKPNDVIGRSGKGKDYKTISKHDK